MAWRATIFPPAFRFPSQAGPKTADNARPGQPGFFYPMDKKKTWRDQEQQLVERWTAANERYPLAHAGNASARVQAARGDVALARREVARLKSECNTGKRY